MNDNLYDLNSFKKKKVINSDLANERTPLYVSHKNGKVSSKIETDDFGSQLDRIRSSLEKINKLMEALKNV